MRVIYHITLITYKEGVRHRLIFGITVAAALLVLLSVFGSGLFMRDLLKVLLNISLSATTIAGLLIPLFYTITQLSGDIEKRTIYSILSKNITRSQYIVGRFTGVSLLTFVVMSILLIATFISIYIAQSLYAEHFFNKLSITSILLSFLTSFFAISLLNAVAIFWCCITTSTFLATLLTIATYFIGQTIEDLVKLAMTQSESMGLAPTTFYFLKTVMYIFPNFASFDFKQYAAHGLPINIQDFTLLFIYCAAFSTILLFAAVSFFKRRDI